MNIFSRIKESIKSLEKINTILSIQQNTSLKQNENIAMLRIVIDNFVIDNHNKRFGIYTLSNNSKLKSSVCRMQDLLDNNKWINEMGKTITRLHSSDSDCVMNRKAWEFVFITQALYERGMLATGKKGLGFAVGKEPLPALFAKYGCEIIATDIDCSTETGKVWVNTNQHSGNSLNNLYKADICDRDIFYKNVSFKSLDMNAIPDDFTDYDFCWSSCAFEHLGSIEKGKQFIYNMIKCLKPGGIAVHTTEYNLSSYCGGLDNTLYVVFGQQDFEEMRNTLIAQGHYVEDLDFRLGNYGEENYIAYPPYKNPHFKLFINDCDKEYISTSFGLIIKKGVKES